MISPLAYIDPEAQIGQNVEIVPFVFIDRNVVIGDNNKIIYVDQKAATGSTVTFGVNGEDTDYVYPNLDEVGKDQELTLLITSNDGTAMKKTTLYYSTGGSYDVKQYMLGDVNEDGDITPADALEVLKHAVGKITLTGN